MAPLTYAVAGVGLMVFSNLVRRLPATRRPWEHVAFFGVGWCVGTQMEKARLYLRSEVAYQEDKRADHKAKRAAQVEAWKEKKKQQTLQAEAE